MLNDQYGMSPANQCVKSFQQNGYIMVVQARGGFVKDEERRGGILLC